MFSPPQRDPDFRWAEDDSVILEPRRALAVYVNQRSEVVLRMERDWNDDDSFVYFPFNDAEMVAARIMDLVRNPADNHNAPRQCVLSESPPAKATMVATAETLLDRMERGAEGEGVRS